MLNKITQFSLVITASFSLMIGSAKPITVKADDFNGVVEERYSTIFSNWGKDGVKSPLSFQEIIVPSQLNHSSILLSLADSKGYDKEALHVKANESYSFEVNVEEEGLYELTLDYMSVSDGLTAVEAEFKINDVYPYYEARRVVFSKFWSNEGDEFPTDRYGNEVVPSQNQVNVWQTMFLSDASHTQPGHLKVYLKSGLNKIEFTQKSGEVLIGEIIVQSEQQVPNYDEYSNQYQDQELIDSKLTVIEAEHNSYKNDTGIRQSISRDIEVSPYDTYQKLLNTFGGDSWAKAGQAVYYEVEVPESGLYKLAFKVKQNFKPKESVFRTITMDHEIPFEEAKNFKFDNSGAWETVEFGEDTPYLIYLEKGTHIIGLEVGAEPYASLVNLINDMMSEISDLSLEVKKLVGTNDDRYRDWEISEYIPDIEERLVSMAQRLENEYNIHINEQGVNPRAQAFTKVQRVIDILKMLAKDPNDIPNSLSVLSEGSSSASQMLGDTIAELQKQPLLMDQLYLYTDDESLPDYQVSVFKKLSESVKRFAHSFLPSEKEEVVEDEIVLDIWVNRARNYVDLMQKTIDNDFTAKTGIKVNLSLMPSEQKLILANSSGFQPDIALGVSTGIPYEFAIRNSALDLRQFEEFDSYMNQFSPGAFMRYIIDDSVYALPETQDFYVTFYRQDILDSLNLPVPQTWDEVIDILPELQRNGMNFYSPLALAGGQKPFMYTSPFIYQYGGDLYQADGMGTALNSEESLEAIKMMTNLFTIYGLPLQVPNFYNHFRYGTLPIGIGNFGDYLKIKNAAPELEGSWALAPHPGIKYENGEIQRWAAGSAQACMVFSDTEYPEQSWEFLKWWMSKEVQVNYAYELQTLYGNEYMWNSANVDAFMELPWDEEDKAVIAEQWDWIMEIPNIPGGYMAERELSNAWNKIVFDDENPRSAIDDAINSINREIKRKLEEFEYTKNGVLVKPYEVPTIEKVESWVKE